MMSIEVDISSHLDGECMSFFLFSRRHFRNKTDQISCLALKICTKHFVAFYHFCMSIAREQNYLYKIWPFWGII